MCAVCSGISCETGFAQTAMPIVSNEDIVNSLFQRFRLSGLSLKINKRIRHQNKNQKNKRFPTALNACDQLNCMTHRHPTTDSRSIEPALNSPIPNKLSFFMFGSNFICIVLERDKVESKIRFAKVFQSDMCSCFFFLQNYLCDASTKCSVAGFFSNAWRD